MGRFFASDTGEQVQDTESVTGSEVRPAPEPIFRFDRKDALKDKFQFDPSKSCYEYRRNPIPATFHSAADHATKQIGNDKAFWNNLGKKLVKVSLGENFWRSTYGQCNYSNKRYQLTKSDHQIGALSVGPDISLTSYGQYLSCGYFAYFIFWYLDFIEYQCVDLGRLRIELMIEYSIIQLSCRT